MALPGSYTPYQFRGPFRAGTRVMGHIPGPHTRPNYWEQAQLALPDARYAAVRTPDQVWSINRPLPRNLFPGRVQMRFRPAGW